MVLATAARRAIERNLPEAAAAVVEFVYGPPADPHRVGKALRSGLEGRWCAPGGHTCFVAHPDPIADAVDRIARQA